MTVLVVLLVLALIFGVGAVIKGILWLALLGLAAVGALVVAAWLKVSGARR